VACKQEYRCPDGTRFIAVLEEGPRVANGTLEFMYRVHLCRHCIEPDCAAVCPEEAITRRDDGIVILDEAACTACRLCIDACPFDAIVFDSDADAARKCNLCFHRVDNGLPPACADNVCPGHCIYFGDPVKIKRTIRQKHARRPRRPAAAARH
jgi:Fe-S-cluster-containing dehydrogenase component